MFSPHLPLFFFMLLTAPSLFLLRMARGSLSVPSRSSLLCLSSFFALLAAPRVFLVRDASFFAAPCVSLLIRCPLLLPARSLFVAPCCFWLIAWHLLFATRLWSTYLACFSFTVYLFSFLFVFLVVWICSVCFVFRSCWSNGCFSLVVQERRLCWGNQQSNYYSSMTFHQLIQNRFDKQNRSIVDLSMS